MNKVLEQTLKDERTGKRGIWYYIERTHKLELKDVDKLLIISQLRGYCDDCWDSLWKHTTLILERFGYL